MGVIDKSIQECCNGCGICVAICPQDVFRIDKDTKKAIIKYPDDCVACASCESFCPLNCIEVTLHQPREVPSPY